MYEDSDVCSLSLAPLNHDFTTEIFLGVGQRLELPVADGGLSTTGYLKHRCWDILFVNPTDSYSISIVFFHLQHHLLTALVNSMYKCYLLFNINRPTF